MSRKILTAVALLVAMIGGALAQTPAPTAPASPIPPATPAPSPQAAPVTPAPLTTPGAADSNASATPVAVNAAPLEPGANSFTEAQARARLEQAGLAGVTELKKDEQGIWRGRATRNGAAVSVGLDFHGNVRAE